MDRNQGGNKAWSTRDDVNEDLALVTMGGLEVDERYLVYGERPPPRPVFHIDDEMKMLFGAKADEIADIDHKFVEPDLKGIMSMIRMVETDSEDDDYSSKKKPINKIIISKLNPNVREFVPKRASQTLPETNQKTTQNPMTNHTVVQTSTQIPMTDNIVVETTTQIPMTDNIVVETTTQNPKTNNIVVETTTQNPKTNNIVVETTTQIPMTDNIVVETTTQNPKTNNIVVETTTQNPKTNNIVVETTTQIPKTDNIVVETTTQNPKTNNTVVQTTTQSPLPNDFVVQRATPSPLTERKGSKIPSEARSTPTPTLSSATEAEIQSLKDKIVSSSTKDSYQHRREKNAAIATLLRHCTTPPIKKEIKEKPIKLYTPEFFERCKASEFKGTDDSDTEIEESPDEPFKEQTDPVESIAEDEHTNLTPDVAKELKPDNDKEPTLIYEEAEPTSTYKEAEPTSIYKEAEATSTYKEAEPTSIHEEAEATSTYKEAEPTWTYKEPEPFFTYIEAELTSTYEEAEQKKSIVKVNEWLYGPNKPKKTAFKPVMLAGPIAYKRKDVMSPISPTSTTVDKKISKQNNKAFVPSTYAKELRQRYERNRKEANKYLNIWDNLENQLKKKDQEIRKEAGQC